MCEKKKITASVRKRVLWFFWKGKSRRWRVKMKLKCLFEWCLGGGCRSSPLAVSIVYNFSCQSRLDGTLLLISLTKESLEERERESQERTCLLFPHSSPEISRCISLHSPLWPWYGHRVTRGQSLADDFLSVFSRCSQLNCTGYLRSHCCTWIHQPDLFNFIWHFLLFNLPCILAHR